jgi:ABC-2 type transport system ATP-binding protein
VLLLDEPSTGLDPGARRELWAALRAVPGTTVLLTTHLLEEAERCGRVGILHKGRLVALGAPEALRGEIGGDVVSWRAREPARLREGLKERFGVEAEAVDGVLRVRSDRGHELAAKVAEAFPELVEAATVAKPSLEDVFHARTSEAWT